MTASCRTERIKAAVSVRDLLERHGYHPDRHGLLLCPFHSERTPSFRVYPDGRGWYCFGCHKGGDVINLAMGLYGTDFSGACRRLDEAYSLHLYGPDTRSEGQRRADNAAAYRRKYAHRQEQGARERLKERWGVLNARILDLQERLDAGEDIDPADIAELMDKRDGVEWKLEGEIE